MASLAQGAFRLGRIAGIDLYLHWSWFLIALIEIQSRSGRYSSIAWNVLEYVALFLIVLLHEFGHALACRQVGGTANRIMLWPLGGVAYVNPPQRPGATLWSIAAGPLVNVALFPILWGAFFFARGNGWADTMPDAYVFVRAVLSIDIGLLVFNLLPVYPLDGGQIVRSLLWFVLGRGRSLMVTTALSFVGIAGLIALAVWTRSVWTVAIAVFMLMSCWGGLQRARALVRIAKLPRRPGYACPSCRTAPPIGVFWKCGKCSQPFDTFATQGVCPHCAASYATTTCLDCQVQSPMTAWAGGTIEGAATAFRESAPAQSAH
ncbi:MAG: M50 family metallopeptidase [Terracidiphilus sp.]